MPEAIERYDGYAEPPLSQLQRDALERYWAAERAGIDAARAARIDNARMAVIV